MHSSGKHPRQQHNSMSLRSRSSIETVDIDNIPCTLPYPSSSRSMLRNPFSREKQQHFNSSNNSMHSSLEIPQKNRMQQQFTYPHKFHHDLISLTADSLAASQQMPPQHPHLSQKQKKAAPPVFSQLPQRSPSVSCTEHLRSVKVILPTTVAIAVTIMAAVTIALMVLNSNTAVNDIANLLHNQVLAVVESRILSHLDQVLSINTASAKTVNKRPLGLPPANQTPVDDTWLVEHLDSVVNGYALVDVHYVFFRNGRVVASLTNDATTNLYAEEFYPDGLYFWTYPLGNTSAIVANRSNPTLYVSDYEGSTRSYFNTVSRTTSYDYAWTNPYMVGPLLLFTNTVSMVDSAGVFQGAMGADSYITTLTQFFTTLHPTPDTKSFLTDVYGLLVIATHGSVLHTTGPLTGTQVAATASEDSTVAASASAMGNFATISTSIRRAHITDGEKWLLSYRRLEILRAVLIVGVITPEDEFLGSVRAATSRTIGICVAIAVVGLIIVTVLCIIISRALGRLERRLDRVAHLDIDDDDTLSQSSSSGFKMKGAGSIFSELQRTDESYVRLRAALGAFRRYVPQSVVHGVLNGDILPLTSMTPCQVAVTFHDIANFTSMCEFHNPHSIVQLVSGMFEHMSAIILKNNGTIDKYIGDAIMSFWEVGKPGTTTAKEACEACVKVMLQTYLTSALGPDGEMVRFRAGGHFGEALIGNFGSSTRFSYTVVGDTVNSAARLEPLNKQLKTDVLISHEVFCQITSRDLLRHVLYMGRTLLMGKAEEMMVYSITEVPLSRETVLIWKETVNLFEDGQYEAARNLLLTRSFILSEEPMAQELLDTITQYLACVPTSHIGCRLQLQK